MRAGLRWPLLRNCKDRIYKTDTSGDDMKQTPASPRIVDHSWGHIEIADGSTYRDAKLYPGGAREWNWAETGTRHTPGIQLADVKELLDHGAIVVILSRGVHRRLQVKPDTLKELEALGVGYHVLQTDDAVRMYNDIRERQPVGGLFHSTC